MLYSSDAITPQSSKSFCKYISLSFHSFCIWKLSMDSARVFPCMVCSHPHLISHIEEKKMLLKNIDGNIDIISDIAQYDCLQHASASHHFLTTRLQYRTLKYLCAISSMLTKLNLKHSVTISPSHPYVCGPLTCFQRSFFS